MRELRAGAYVDRDVYLNSGGKAVDCTLHGENPHGRSLRRAARGCRTMYISKRAPVIILCSENSVKRGESAQQPNTKQPRGRANTLGLLLHALPSNPEDRVQLAIGPRAQPQ